MYDTRNQSVPIYNTLRIVRLVDVLVWNVC